MVKRKHLLAALLAAVMSTNMFAGVSAADTIAMPEINSEEIQAESEMLRITYSSEAISDTVQKITVNSSILPEGFLFYIQSDMVICDEDAVPYESGVLFAKNLTNFDGIQVLLSNCVEPAENKIRIVGVNLPNIPPDGNSFDLFYFYVLGDKPPVLTMLPECMTTDGSEHTYVKDFSQNFYVPTFEFSPDNGFLGDVDNNGEIEVGDAIGIFKHMASTQLIHDSAVLRADINANGEIDTGDAIEIFKHIADVESEYGYSIGGRI